MTDFKAMARMETNIQKQAGVDNPRFPRRCWATRRAYTGARFPSFVNCQKNARPGHLTCSHHKDREQAAQELKASLERKA